MKKYNDFGEFSRFINKLQEIANNMVAKFEENKSGTYYDDVSELMAAIYMIIKEDIHSSIDSVFQYKTPFTMTRLPRYEMTIIHNNLLYCLEIGSEKHDGNKWKLEKDIVESIYYTDPVSVENCMFLIDESLGYV